MTTTTGIWTASPGAVEILVVESDGKYAANERVSKLVRRGAHLVNDTFYLRRRPGAATEETHEPGDLR
jgi:hypothetical protein